MKSPFEVLGIPKEVVEQMKSDDSLPELLNLCKKIFADYARYLHADINPASAGLYNNMASAIEELNMPTSFNLAVRQYVEEIVDRAERIRRRDRQQESDTKRESLAAALGLLRNISQFRVMGVNRSTSIMLQFGTARTILDVMDHDRTYLSLSATAVANELPEQSEKPKYANGCWSEQFLNQQGTLSSYVHRPNRIGKVDIVGFVPAAAFKYRSDEDFSIHSDASELEEGSLIVRTALSWAPPETAWYLSKMVEEFTNGVSVVVRHGHNGYLALVGTVQAQDYLQLGFSKKI